MKKINESASNPQPRFPKKEWQNSSIENLYHKLCDPLVEETDILRWVRQDLLLFLRTYDWHLNQVLNGKYVSSVQEESFFKNFYALYEKCTESFLFDRDKEVENLFQKLWGPIAVMIKEQKFHRDIMSVFKETKSIPGAHAHSQTKPDLQDYDRSPDI